VERIAPLPESYHWVRNVRVGPDGWIYVGVGSDCNVCEDSEPRRAAILRFRPRPGDRTGHPRGGPNKGGRGRLIN
jgi:glucose/arabinose dehydrogenase